MFTEQISRRLQDLARVRRHARHLANLVEQPQPATPIVQRGIGRDPLGDIGGQYQHATGVAQWPVGEVDAAFDASAIGLQLKQTACRRCAG